MLFRKKKKFMKKRNKPYWIELRMFGVDLRQQNKLTLTKSLNLETLKILTTNTKINSVSLVTRDTIPTSAAVRCC